MNALESIEMAIRELSEPERWSLLQRFDAELTTAWDGQIAADSAAGRLDALAYVIDPDHVQYCHLDREEQAQIIARATGGRGRNRDYLWSTAAHLAELGISDPDLDWLADRVRALT